MLTVQFHPNWPHQERTVIESMVADGVYRSQFATGISNGGLGGDRWAWESRCGTATPTCTAGRRTVRRTALDDYIEAHVKDGSRTSASTCG